MLTHLEIEGHFDRFLAFSNPSLPRPFVLLRIHRRALRVQNSI